MLFIVSGVKIYEFNCTQENGCQEFNLKLAAGVKFNILVIQSNMYKHAMILILIRELP
jgi:hypothetical protein